jgi:hypothetical protein
LISSRIYNCREQAAAQAEKNISTAKPKPDGMTDRINVDVIVVQVVDDNDAPNCQLAYYKHMGFMIVTLISTFDTQTAS